MAIGVYGVKRPADVDPSDIEVIVLYSKTRNATETQTITKLKGTDVMKQVLDPTNPLEVLGGSNKITDWGLCWIGNIPRY